MGDAPVVVVDIQRLSGNDLLQQATDVGPVPMQVGAVLVLGDGPPLDVDIVRAALAERIVGIPRLRQRLTSTPPGCGRPIWVTDDGFDVREQVRSRPCPAPGDEGALLRAAAEVVFERLPRDRPLWSATVVTGSDVGDALVLVFDHVLADGIGGLAVLAGLVDGVVPISAGPSVERPSTRALFVDAWRTRLRQLGRVRNGVALVRSAWAELGQGRKPARCTLNRPIGNGRHFEVERVPLGPVVDVGHRVGVTVNDVVLTAVAGALAATLADRGDDVPEAFVVSVPVSARQTTDRESLGNQVGVMPVAVPTAGAPAARLLATAAERRRHQDGPAGASAGLLGPLFRLLVRLGLFRPFIERQRLIHTVATNLRGPAQPLAFLGREITAVVPLTSLAGNVPVAFAVLSYAGTLGITVVSDPAACPDHASLARHLADELDVLVSVPAEPGSRQPA
jgi:WS/DGAT/MGAT family acyltransferase